MIDPLGVILLFAVVSLVILLVYIFWTSSEPNVACFESEKTFFDPRSKQNISFPSLLDKATIHLTVVVPAYNEEERLPIMMEDTMGYLTNRQSKDTSFQYEVIIVDDGSKDKTTQVARRFSEQYGINSVRVLTLEKNRGKGGAVRLGVLRSRGREILFADADGATRFADVDKLEAELSKLVPNSPDGLAVVCGSRAHLEQDSIAQRSLFRTLLMYVFHFLVWFFCVRGIRDTQCGFKLFSRSAAQLLFLNQHVERWAFDIDLLYIAQHYRVPIAEVAVNWREIPGSKLSPVLASIQMARDLVIIRLRYITGAWKMQHHIKKKA